jgi:REP element-mobilizing transposase RayT
VEYEGAVHHVTMRVLGYRDDPSAVLFRDDRDRGRFLLRVSERCERFNVRLLAYCLMLNHCHLLVQTPDANLSRFMQSISTAYTVYFNLRHGRHGHLLQGRFGAKLVAGDSHLLTVSRYVHLNPVRTADMAHRPLAERLRHLRAFRWSSYGNYVSGGQGIGCVEEGPVLSCCGVNPQVQRREYRQFVEGALAMSKEELAADLGCSTLGFGDDEFQAWVATEYRKAAASHRERDSLGQRETEMPVPAECVLTVAARAFGVTVEDFGTRRWRSELRGAAASLLARYAGMAYRDIAMKLGVRSTSGVARQAAATARRRQANPDLDRMLRAAESELSAAGGHSDSHKVQSAGLTLAKDQGAPKAQERAQRP